MQSAARVWLVRSAPPRPAGAAPRPAARRRCQGDPQAAAYPQASSPAPLWESVARLGDLLSQSRINRKLVSEQLEFVKKDVQILEWQAAFTKRDLQYLVVDYLRMQGMLHPQGLLEFAEQKLFAPLSLDPPKDRLSDWQQLGWRHPNLEDSIPAANPSWQADMIPAKAEELDSQLSRLADQGYMPKSNHKVVLKEAPLSPEFMRFLKCLADAVHCPCEMRYKPK